MDYRICEANLNELIKTYRDLKTTTNHIENEAQTRFQFIDDFLVKCLGWNKNDIVVERNLDRTRTDYEIGRPKRLIIEAKSDLIDFTLPARRKNKHTLPITQITNLNQALKDAIEQVMFYCYSRGVKYGCVANGATFIVFIACRQDSIPPKDGLAFVIENHTELLEQFSLVYDLLAPDGIAAQKLQSYLTTEGEIALPEKLIRQIPAPKKIRYNNKSSSDLGSIAELILEDISKNSDDINLETQFYKQCYCDTGPISQHALISKNLLQSRYSALFPIDEDEINLQPIKNKKNKLAPDLLASSLARRPIIIVGDVGVGKTSFLRNLMLVEAADDFKKAIKIYINIAPKALFDSDLNNIIREEIIKQLSNNQININDATFIKKVYENEISEFAKGLHGELRSSNPSKYQEKLLEMLEAKTQQHDEHFKLIFDYITYQYQKQIIVIIDNIDQRDYEIQQNAFIIAQGMAESWNCFVFLSVRPNTFHYSKRVGSLAAYPNKMFYIMPPRPDEALRKRLIFALNIAEGKFPIKQLQNVSINLTNIAYFIKALLYSVQQNKEVQNLLYNITGGNVREMFDFITKFIGNSNIDSDKIIDTQREQGSYLIPVHEFSKAALLGNYSYFDNTSSMAFNLYDIKNPDPKEHFLCSIILGYLLNDGNHRNIDGFVSMLTLHEELQSYGYHTESIDNAIRKLTNKKLIDNTGRITFEESMGQLIGDTNGEYRSTTIGAYHFYTWSGDFSYLDAILFDTPIMDENIRLSLAEHIGSFDIRHRYTRTQEFVKYLDTCWTSIEAPPKYYSWPLIRKTNINSFHKVERHLNN